MLKAMKPFYLVYDDLWTSLVVSINTNAKYYLLLVNDYSRTYEQISLIHHKNFPHTIE